MPWRKLSLREQKFAALDLENTGLNPFADRIVEVGVVLFDLKGEDLRHSWLINPMRDIPQRAQEIHGISEEDVKDCLLFEEVWPEILSLLKERVLVIHNPNADLPFLEMESIRTETRIPKLCAFDTVKLSRKAWPHLDNHRLETVCKFLGFPLDAHRALEDALGAKEVFLKALQELEIDLDLSLSTLKRNYSLVCTGMINETKGRTIKDLWVKRGARYRIEYYNSRGEETTRIIHVEKIFLKGRQTVIQAYCETREETRLFFAKNIVSIQKV